MKIMTSMYTLRKGGAYERFLMMLAALLEKGCEVHCLSLVPIPLKHPCYHNHPILFPFQGKNGWVAKSITLLLFPLYALLTGWREKVDLFISFGPLYAFLQAFPKWILKRPMVTFIRSDLTLGFKKRDIFNPFSFLNGMMEYVGLLFTDHTLAVNTAIRQEIMKTVGRRKKMEVEVLSNNIPEIKRSSPEDRLETRNGLGIPKQAKVLVTAGVLTPCKNVDVLLKSLSNLEMEDWFLLVIGDHPEQETSSYTNYLKALARKLDLRDKVIFKGWVQKEELWKILCAADLFVMPSVKEGMPNVMLEAMGCGVACLGSNIPGIRDILHHEILMFDPCDAESIVNKVRRFFSDPEYFHYVHELCRERKRLFVFDWKGEVFHRVMKGIRSKG
jgi:glycosyltransferase involved in cell wall biosynthesis